MRSFQTALVWAYAIVVLGSLLLPWGPRAFWTVIMPLVPATIVVLGFHRWRRLCPIARLGEATPSRHGARLPSWMRGRALLVSFGVLLACLCARLVATNGDRIALAVFLAGLPVTAFLINRRYGGRAFCHYACPVGVVERIYTDAAPALVPEAGSSRCQPCTGCVRGCADIDRDRAYDTTLRDKGRRLVFFAFPGLVFGFYFYYFLRGGSWDAYFDGRWTEAPLTLDGVFGAGFVGAEGVPAIVAAALTLLGCSMVSLVAFTAIETWLARASASLAEARHRALMLASFVAFNVFYLFAGAPTFRLLPGLPRVVGVVAMLVAATALVHRLGRYRPAREPRRLPVVSQ